MARPADPPRRRTFLPSLGLAALVLAAPGASAEATAVETAEDVRRCVERNLPDDSSVQTVRLAARDQADQETVSRAKIYWKDFDGRSRMVLEFDDPSSLRGAGLLLIERSEEEFDMFMYLPELRKVKRVTGRTLSGSFFGTDFTYEEFRRLQGMSENARSRRLPDETLEGRAVYVVESRPAEPEEVSLERVVSFVDRETCVPLRIEFYERGEEPHKVLETDVSRITMENGHHVPRRTVMRDLRDETRTELVVEDIKVDARIRRAVFSQRYLESQGR